MAAAIAAEEAVEPPRGPDDGPLSGWLSKKGGLRWQKRFFVLDGLDLKYYLSEEDWAGNAGVCAVCGRARVGRCSPAPSVYPVRTLDRRRQPPDPFPVAEKLRGSLALSGRTTISTNQGDVLKRSDPDGTRFQLILGRGKASSCVLPLPSPGQSTPLTHPPTHPASTLLGVEAGGAGPSRGEKVRVR